jgi:hypothetical protein
VCTVEPPPSRLRHVEELVGHQPNPHARARALRHALAQSHRRERRLDHIRRAEMLPVLGGEVEEREQRISVLLQRRDGLRYLASYSVTNHVIAARGPGSTIHNFRSYLARRGPRRQCRGGAPRGARPALGDRSRGARRNGRRLAVARPPFCWYRVSLRQGRCVQTGVLVRSAELVRVRSPGLPQPIRRESSGVALRASGADLHRTGRALRLRGALPRRHGGELGEEAREHPVRVGDARRLRPQKVSNR